MKTKKIVSTLIALMLVAVLFAACSTQSPAENAPAGSDTTDTADTPADAAADDAADEPADEPVAAGDGEAITVGVLYQGLDSPFVISLQSAMDALDASRDDIELISLDGLSDPQKQVSQGETLIQQGVDVIALNGISVEGCAPIVEAANAANIPIFTMIGPVSNQDKALTLVGSDHEESGEIEMRMLASDFDGKAKIAVIEGPLGHSAQIGRLAGYEKVMEEYPEIEIVVQNTANWQRDEAMSLVENWLQTGVEFDAIASENDNMALGAIKALEDAGLQDKIKVYGVDGDDDALQAVKEGRQAGTVLQSAKGQAEMAFKVIDMIKEGKTAEIDPDSLVPFIGVTTENVDEIITNK